MICSSVHRPFFIPNPPVRENSSYIWLSSPGHQVKNRLRPPVPKSGGSTHFRLTESPLLLSVQSAAAVDSEPT
jgi:hypothetical protein